MGSQAPQGRIQSDEAGYPQGAFVSILLSGSSPLHRFGFFRRTPASNWLTIPAADPQGLTSTIEGLLGVYGGRDATLGVEGDEPPAPPKVEPIPAARWRRLLALALDAFVLVSLLATVALAKTAHLKEGEEADGTEFYALVVVIAWVLYIWITNVIGVSLGKLQLGLRVVRLALTRLRAFSVQFGACRPVWL
jgi:hypothetical protein